MKKIIFALLILVCALLFSCATDSGSDIAVENGTPHVIAGGPEAATAGKTAASASSLISNPVYAKWVAEYEVAGNPSFFGKPLIVDNAAFADIPADVRTRKEKAEALADQNRFLDAWYAYGEDDSEYIVALKILHAIDCFTDTIMNQMFVFTNLAPDQDLNEYRENPSQKGEKVFWDPVEAAETYVAENCNGVMPHILEMALACYYECSAFEFGDDWFMDMEDTYELSVEYFKKTIVAGVYNDYALYRSIDSFLSAGYISEALEVIHCLELSQPDYSYHYYQEALAYMYMGEYQKAKSCAAKAVLLSQIPTDAAAGAQIFADAFMYDNQDINSALAVIEAAKPYMLDEYYEYNVFKALDIMLYGNQMGKHSYNEDIIRELTDAFAYEPHDDDYLWSLTDLFYSYECPEIGIRWMVSILPDWKEDNLASGRLNFELGQLYVQVGDWQKALECFTNAEVQLKAAGVYDTATSNIPYYQNVCREQMLSQPQKNKI
ncbi:MAG: hypothetical protein KBT02_01985 [Treponema sp.]|nr:hypothetical protein [Candidatus Treponema caballi]